VTPEEPPKLPPAQPLEPIDGEDPPAAGRDFAWG
jgi:hypothetical protein